MSLSINPYALSQNFITCQMVQLLKNIIFRVSGLGLNMQELEMTPALFKQRWTGW